jgi:hypothetical protein
MILTKETGNSRWETFSLCPQQIWHGLAGDRNHTFAMRNRQETTWAKVQPMVHTVSDWHIGVSKGTKEQSLETFQKVKCLRKSQSGAFGKSLCTYKRCWKWCPRASIWVWTRLILFASTLCRSAFRKSLCTCKRSWKWCPRASIQAWTHTVP